MDAQALIAALAAQGGRLLPIGEGDLRILGPPGQDAAMRDAVHAHKVELLQLIEERKASHATRPTDPPVADPPSVGSSRETRFHLASDEASLYREFTAIRNVVYDCVMPVLDPSVWKVLTYLIRRIDGWAAHRQEGSDTISVPQIMKGTNQSRNTIKAALRDLAAWELITNTAEQRTNGATKAPTIRLTLPKSVEEWEGRLSNFDTQCLSKFDRGGVKD